MSYHLLTGATGLLGRYLIRDLTQEGIDLAVLVRPSRKQSPHERIEALMRHWDNEYGYALPRPVVLSGDISEPDLGLSPTEIKWAAENCEALIHNAASLSFVSTSRRSEPWRSNVQGTQYVLDFCEQAQIGEFFHVSTAYTCGLRQGRIHESELDQGQEFGNDYEESKVEAEKLTRAASFLDSLTVFRPAIIIGDSDTGLTTTFHNFYAMLQLANTMANQMVGYNHTGKCSAQSFGFDLDGTERKNLVPVNWVSAVMSHLISTDRHHGETYHLTPRCPVTMRLMCDVIEEVIGIYGVKFYGAGATRGEMSEIEELFFQQMQVYSSYWRDDPEFDTTNTAAAAPHLPCPHISRDTLTRLAQAAMEMRFNWSDPAVEELVEVGVPASS